MLLLDLMVALAVALLVTAIFAAGLRGRSVWPNWLVFFGLVLLAAWAGGVWIRPVGPPAWGVYWVPFLLVGLVIALLLAVTLEPERAQRRRAAAAEPGGKSSTVFSVLMWVLTIGLAIAILLAYV
jgi:hypothetical protein